MLPIAAVLAVALAALPVPAAPARAEAPSAAAAANIGVHLWVQNWGDAVTLTNPNDPGYAQIASGEATTTINAVIDFHSDTPERFTATLVDAQAIGGRQSDPCISATTPEARTCEFDVAVGDGVNVLTLTIDGPGDAPLFVEQGWITGGLFRYSTGLEAQDAAGDWQRIPDRGELRLPATTTTSVRYVVRNVGGVPIRVDGSCDDGIIEEGSSITCPVTGPRPVASLATAYHRNVLLQDPIGWRSRVRFDGSVTGTATSFLLSDPRAAVGQKVSLRAQGLTDRDLGQLVVRVGSRPVRLDSESTPARLVFAMPLAATGPTTLEVLESGITVARLPLTVTAHPASTEPAAFPAALVVFVSIGGALLALLLWRGVTVALRSRVRVAQPRP